MKKAKGKLYKSRSMPDGSSPHRKAAKALIRGFNNRIRNQLDAHAERLGLLEDQLTELQANHQLLPIPNQKGMYFQLIGEIIYCSAQSNQTDIFCRGRDFKAVNLTLKDIDEQLTPYGFLRVHQSFLVNKRFIRKLYERELTLEGGIILEVSRRKTAAIRQILTTK